MLDFREHKSAIIPSLENVLAVMHFVNLDPNRFANYQQFWSNNYNAMEKILHIMNGYHERIMDHVYDGDLTGYERNMHVRVARLVLWKEIGCSVPLEKLIGPKELYDYPEIDPQLKEIQVDDHLETSMDNRFNYLNADETIDDLFIMWIVKSYQLLMHSQSDWWLQYGKSDKSGILMELGKLSCEKSLSNSTTINNTLIVDVTFDQLTDFNVRFPNARLLILRSEVVFEDYEVIGLKILNHVNRTNFPKLKSLELLKFPYFALENIVNSDIINGLDSLRIELDDANYFEDGNADLSLLYKHLPKKSLSVDFFDFPEPNNIIEFYALSEKHNIFTSISSKMVNRRFKKRW